MFSKCIETLKKPKPLAMSVLIIILFGVFFILPKWVPEVEKENIVRDAPAITNSLLTDESPWQDAQLAKARKNAQLILAEMLKLQDELEKKQVQKWAKEDYKKALEIAQNADSEYRQRNFNLAQGLYRNALDKFMFLQSSINPTYQKQLVLGRKAINLGDSKSAKKAFSVALMIAPSSSEAKSGMAQANALKQVTNLIRQGQLLEKTEQLEIALKYYQQALIADPKSQKASLEIKRVKSTIEENKFSTSMSSGYSALDQGDFKLAKEKFKYAKLLKPTAKAPSEAIVQVDNKKSAYLISKALIQANGFENEEMWSEASRDYQHVLNIDNSVIEARVGLLRSSARLNLDKQMNKTIAQPNRLKYDPVYQEALNLLADAKMIKKPGPILQQKITLLEKILMLSNTEVSVQLESDNLTSITLYQVGVLGTFSRKDIQLKPGSYTLVGTRDGYRDVRREFQVNASPEKESSTSVQIRCEDKVSAFKS